jgi:hypothetical protein
MISGLKLFMMVLQVLAGFLMPLVLLFVLHRLRLRQEPVLDQPYAGRPHQHRQKAHDAQRQSVIKQ